MNIIKYLTVMPISLVICTANAQLNIEDFENYPNEAALQAKVRSFGMAKASEPTLAVGKGINNSNAVCFELTWKQGKSANLNFVNIPSEVEDLRTYSEIQAHITVETVHDCTPPENPTIVKLVVLGGPQNTVWQTRTENAVKLSENEPSKLVLRLSTQDMERIAGNATLEETLSDVKNIRFRFENDLATEVSENVYIDSIVAVETSTSNKFSSNIITQVNSTSNRTL